MEKSGKAAHADVQEIVDALEKVAEGVQRLGLQCEAIRQAQRMLVTQSQEVAMRRARR